MLCKEKGIFQEKVLAYILPPERTINIDDENDLLLQKKN